MSAKYDNNICLLNVSEKVTFVIVAGSNKPHRNKELEDYLQGPGGSNSIHWKFNAQITFYR